MDINGINETIEEQDITMGSQAENNFGVNAKSCFVLRSLLKWFEAWEEKNSGPDSGRE